MTRKLSNSPKAVASREYRAKRKGKKKKKLTKKERGQRIREGQARARAEGTYGQGNKKRKKTTRRTYTASAITPGHSLKYCPGCGMPLGPVVAALEINEALRLTTE